MAEISARMVMDLRGRTGLGMMECKKALTDAGGDPDKAEELLRIRSGAKASKAADRIASEGVVALAMAEDARSAAIVEVNCETDFVARNEDFRAFAQGVAELVLRHAPADLAALSALALPSGETVEDRRTALVQKIGENVSVRRFERLEALGMLASYIHGTRIGVVVDFEGGDAALGKDLAMHVAASKPVAVDRANVAAETIAKERTIAAARAAESGKPANIVEKMVEGAVAKFIAEVTLTGQSFVKGDGKETVGQLLKSRGAKVHAFLLVVVGQGLEKRKDDFAGEVAAMTRRPEPDGPGATV